MIPMWRSIVHFSSSVSSATWLGLWCDGG